MNESIEQQELSILSGVRDNLLKPMAAEICSKIEASITAKEENINAKIIDQAERMKQAVETETASLFEKIQQSLQSKILSALIEESKKVTWNGEL